MLQSTSLSSKHPAYWCDKILMKSSLIYMQDIVLWDAVLMPVHTKTNHCTVHVDDIKELILLDSAPYQLG